MEERFKALEDKTENCTKAINDCSTSITLLREQLTHKNELTERQMEISTQRMDQLQDSIVTQTYILHGNPKQDTKDRGLIGDVEQLKSTDARKKKYYWITIPVVVAILGGSIWNSILGMGKEDHGRTETKANKTSPDSGRLPRHDRNR